MNIPDSDVKVTYSAFPDVYAREVTKYADTPWQELVQSIENAPEAVKKDDLRLLKLATFGDKRSKHGSLRHDENVLAVYGIEGDYDNKDGSNIDIDSAADRIDKAGYLAYLHTSPSHTEAAPRWRVLLPLSRPHEPHERAALVARLNGVLGGILAPESFTLSQPFYFGRVRGAVFDSRQVAGACIDTLPDAEEPAPRWPTRSKPSGSDSIGDERELDRVQALHSVTDDTMAELKSALGVNPATGKPYIDADDYNTCISVGEGLYSLAKVDREGEANDLWAEWLALSPKFAESEAYMLAKWDGFSASRTDYRAVFKLAQDGGWTNPRSKPEAPSAEAVIEKLRRMDAAEVRSAWIADALFMVPSEVGKVVDEVHRLTGSGKGGLKSDLKQARTEYEREQKKARTLRRAGDRVQIHYRPEDQTQQAMQVEQAIVKRAAPGDYIQFCGMLSRVALRQLPGTHLIDDEAASAPTVPQLDPLDEVGVRRLAEGAVVFLLEGPQGPAPMNIPDKIIDILLRKTEHKAPRVTGLVTHPIVLLNGEVLASDGPHEASGLYLSGANVGEITPYTQAQAQQALDRIRSAFLDGFEFASTLDESAALAGLFTGMERLILDQAPGLAVLASVQASGKTTLARKIHILLTGQDMPVNSFHKGNDEEMKKLLLSMLLRSPSMVCFDNITDGLTFRSGELAAAMTAQAYSGRVLGLSKEVTVQTQTLFTITGNNLSLGPDEVSRWLVVRLTSAQARPEERRFANSDVVAHTLRVRAEVLRDVAGIVSGYLKHGSGTVPAAGTRFPRWDKLVRQPLIWAGAEDTGAVFSRNADESDDTMALESLFNVLAEVYGVSRGDDDKEHRFLATDVVHLARNGHKRNATTSLDAEGAEQEASRRDQLTVALETLKVSNVASTKSVSRGLQAILGRVVPFGPPEARRGGALDAIKGGGQQYLVIRARKV